MENNNNNNMLDMPRAEEATITDEYSDTNEILIRSKCIIVHNARLLKENKKLTQALSHSREKCDELKKSKNNLILELDGLSKQLNDLNEKLETVKIREQKYF